MEKNVNLFRFVDILTGNRIFRDLKYNRRHRNDFENSLFKMLEIRNKQERHWQI